MSWLAAPPPGMSRMNLAGVDVFIHTQTLIFGPVTFGAFTVVRKGAFLVGASPIEIGAFVDVGEGCHLATHEQHMPFLPSTFIFADVFGMPWSRGCGLVGLDAEKREVDPKPIRIGNDVSLGQGVTVAGGVTIGDGCVIRAQSLVKGDCEPYGIYEGVPARRIADRFPKEIVAQLQSLRWWTWPLARIQRNSKFFAQDLTRFEGDLQTLILD
jgi:virginiamycin A acetyltransferase